MTRNCRVLTEEEATTLFDFDVESKHVKVGTEKKSWLVVASVLTCRKFNVNAFIETSIGVWRPFKGAEGRSIDDNLFLFEFNHEWDMLKVLNEGPWHFNNHLIVTQQVNSVEEAVDAEMRYCQFWIQILKLSPLRISKAQAQGLGAQLGRFIAYEDVGMAAIGSDCVRLRVEIDITKPIRRGILTVSKGRQLWYDIRYEKLPNYCFWCGGFDHVEKDCLAAFEDGASEEDERRFVNLRAIPLRKTFLKVANAQSWSGNRGSYGPRFVHRRGCDEFGERRRTMAVTRDGVVVGVEDGQYIAEVLEGELQTRTPGLVPNLEKSLNDLSITPLDSHKSVSSHENSQEPVGGNAESGDALMARSVCCTSVSKVFAAIKTQLSRKDIGFADWETVGQVGAGHSDLGVTRSGDKVGDDVIIVQGSEVGAESVLADHVEMVSQEQRRDESRDHGVIITTEVAVSPSVV